MTIREIYEESILNDSYWLQILIEFLVFEKEVLTLENYQSELDLYFKPNNQARMNQLLIEYKNEKIGGTKNDISESNIYRLSEL